MALRGKEVSSDAIDLRLRRLLPWRLLTA